MGFSWGVFSGVLAWGLTTTLHGCGGGGSSSDVPQSTCGNEGGGTAICINNVKFSCTNCGSKPCVSSQGHCYSCYGADGKCYKYDCIDHCSSQPCNAGCGTAGGGAVPATNIPSMRCSNCGLTPCVSSAGLCYSCYGSDGHCYKYRCGGRCSATDCSIDDFKVSASNTTVLDGEPSVVLGLGDVESVQVPKMPESDAPLEEGFLSQSDASERLVDGDVQWSGE